MSAAPVVETAGCHCCGSTRATLAGRWWVLPALVAHVRCAGCGRTFNAETGDPNGGWFLVWGLCGAGVAALAALAAGYAPGAP